MLQKVSEESCKQMDKLKIVLKSSQRQRQENQLKLKTMIEELMSELEKGFHQERKEGEMTYDSLLKLLEECCDRIQEAQLR